MQSLIYDTISVEAGLQYYFLVVSAQPAHRSAAIRPLPSILIIQLQCTNNSSFNMSLPASHNKKKKRVAIVGGGAAGMAAAWSLARHHSFKDDDDGVDVTLIEPCENLGGVACTQTVCSGGSNRQQEQYINYGVQGGSPASHRNILLLMKEFSETVDECHLSVSFGQGQYNWTNYEDSELQKRLQTDISRFGTVLKWVSRLEWCTVFLSIDTVLKLARLSPEFRERMVYPLAALFFGTGNQTPHVSAAVVARVFRDPTMALFEYSSERLLDSQPTNFAFGNLQQFYDVKMRAHLEQKGVRILTRHRVDQVLSRSRHGGVSLLISDLSKASSCGYRGGADQLELSSSATSNSTKESSSTTSWDENFDDIVFACPANVALNILGKEASFWERRVLGSVRYFRDLSVTHTDENYIKSMTEEKALGKAMYFIKTYEEDPKLLEMGFDLSAYQSNLRNGIQRSPEEKPQRVYQTIFLDQTREKDLWTLDEIDSSKILDKTWWSAFSHTMTHFRWVVPRVWLLHRPGRVRHSHTYFAGSWTLINTHDIAVASGLAVAERLGAPYPFTKDKLAHQAYTTFRNVAHFSAPRTPKE